MHIISIIVVFSDGVKQSLVFLVSGRCHRDNLLSPDGRGMDELVQ